MKNAMNKTMSASYPTTRLRRLRSNPQLRRLIRETELTINDLVAPLFIHHGNNIKNPITSMPEQYQWSVDRLDEALQEIAEYHIPAVILFGIPAHKDPIGSAAFADNGVIQQAIQYIKQQLPELLVIADVCCCEYTDHGHCGIVSDSNEQFQVDNDQTLPLLAKQAVSFAQAGADIVAPSGMMDGMVQAIRTGLDEASYTNVAILSYAAKYSSAMYGPFRDATQGAPQFGDRQSYQMDMGNAAEALRETALDLAEGADMLMVKPAHTYLDIIWRVKQAHPGVPIAAYHVSGEYAMLQAAIAKGWLDAERAPLEVLTAIKRAGADIIITYYASQVAKQLAGR